MNYFLPKQQDYRISSGCIKPQGEGKLHLIWKSQMGRVFYTDKGNIQVIDPGTLNSYFGPDFCNAVIKFPGELIRKGNVEIHEKCSDWYSHGHQSNAVYGSVILHVIFKGEAFPVHSLDITIPTVKLPLPIKSNFIRPCLELNRSLPLESFLAGMEVFSQIRWDYLCSFYKQNIESTERRILSFMDIKCNQRNVANVIQYYFLEKEFGSETELPVKVLDFASILSWKMGRKRPASHPLKRLPFLLFLLKNHANILLSDLKMNSRNIKKYLQKEQYAEVIPGNDFINEILGNIILPLKQIDFGHDCFEEWFKLPVQPYGKFADLMNHMGYDQPLTFGLQQGLIQLDQEFCRLDHCSYCPHLQSDSLIQN